MSPKSGSNAKPKTPQSPALQHLTAGAKVEIMSDDEGFRGSFFSGTVIRRASSKTPNKYLVEYECLFTDDSGTKPLREIVDTVQIRPLPPPEKKRRTFKFGDEVDACHNDGWWEGVVTEEAEDGKFGVFFRSTREQLLFGEESLRVHREWVDGTWKPPLEEEEEKEEEEEEEEEKEEEEEEEEEKEEEEASIEDVSIATKAKPSKEMERGNVDSKKKTKKTKSSAEAKPSKGKDLDNGEPKKETKKTKSSSEGKPSKEKELENVEPKTEARRTRSSKAVKPESAEPKKEPKKSKSSKATKLEDVEPKKEPKKSKTSKAMKFENVQPEKEPKKSKPTKATNLEDVELDKEPETTDMELNDVVMEEKFPNGMQVEVTSDEDGFKGAWFVGTIVEPVGKDKYLVQYENLRTEDDTDFEKEEFYVLKIRPRPPELHVVDRFKLLEEVDALYNDAWWVGIIVKVLSSKYVVYFKDTQEELHFKHSDLRPHQDWVDGKWVVPSKALDL